jgi:signal transduction histidine kinase
LKRRFLLTIGLVLAVAIGSVGVLQYVLFRSEQYRLIDSRIESTATLLISSELSNSDIKDFEEAEQIISEVVGGEAFNQFFVVYKKTGEELYRSPNAEALPEKIPKNEKWQTIETETGHIIRVLTVPMGRLGKAGKILGDSRTLQTGLILDEDLLRMKTLSRHVIVYSVMILALILMTTFWLAEALLRPLKGLAVYLRHMSTRLDVSAEISASTSEPPVPALNSDDEFGELMTETRRLRDLLGKGLKNTQAWTAQMAHEMKTPLTILQNTLERARSENDFSRREALFSEASSEVGHLNALISSFLEWSAAENFPEISEDLHAVRLGAVAKDLAEKFERQYPGRIRFEGDSNLRVFAKRGFAQQAITNLVTNALRYSPSDSPVSIQILPERIEISDEGAGLPASVADHLGEPFNYGTGGAHGFGLGLAWVRTICRKYGWSLEFERRNSADGKPLTVASIRFPPEEF